jgi:polyisoprenoid-binding protein YceI
MDCSPVIVVMTVTRIIKGVQVPAAGAWKVDPGHAEVGFVGRHLMLTKIRGRFTGVEATVTFGEDLLDTTVEAVIDMTTVKSGFGPRDEHLRSADWFDVETHPSAVFRSTGLNWDGGSQATLYGDLTLKGITRPVELTVDYLGVDTDPWHNAKAVFSAHGTINREDWNLTWNMPLESGGLLVSKEIELVLELEANRVG